MIISGLLSSHVRNFRDHDNGHEAPGPVLIHLKAWHAHNEHIVMDVILACMFRRATGTASSGTGWRVVRCKFETTKAPLVGINWGQIFRKHKPNPLIM